MRRPSTLRSRLALSATAAAALVVLVLTAAFVLLLQRQLSSEARAVVRSRGAAASTTVSVSPTGRLQVAEGQEDAVLDTSVWVFDGSLTVRRPPGQPALQRAAQRLAGTDGRFLEIEDPPTLLLSMAVTDRGRQIGTVVAAVSLEAYRRSTVSTLVGAAVLGTLLVAVVAVVASQVAARALRPMARMTALATSWSADGIPHRFGPGGRPRELEAFAASLDTLLDRLAAAFRREQQLSAEISHELRTPLAGITAEVELFGARPRSTDDGRASIARIAESSRRMEQILETLLSAARAQGPQSTGSCDVRAAGAHLGMEVVVNGELPFVGVSEELLARMLGPVLDNAERYGDTTVVSAKALPDAVLVEVRDDGPGVPAGSEELVFEPGRRLSPEDGHVGAGLGLALARRLAQAAGGDLTATAGPGGAFTLRLPRA